MIICCSFLLGIFIRLKTQLLITIFTPVFVLSILIGTIFIFITVIKSIHKRIFDREGYLTLCLPLKIKEIVFAKILNSIFIYLIYSLALIFAILILLILGKAIDYNFLENIFLMFKNNFSAVILTLFNGLINLVLFISAMLYIMSVLNKKRVKNKIVIGILMYLLFTLCLSAIGVFDFIKLGIVSEDNRIMIVKLTQQINYSIISVYSLLVTIILINIFVYISVFTIKNHLDLE